MTAASCFFVADSAEFDSVLSEETRNDPRLVKAGPKRFGECAATLFFLKPVTRTPLWVDHLRNGFEEMPDMRGGSPGAVLVVAADQSDGLLAFAFGTGRFLLDPDVWVRGFGARAALNIIFEGDDGSGNASRLQAVQATRFETTKLQLSHQAGRSSTRVMGI